MIGGQGESTTLKSLISKSFNNTKINLDGDALFSNDKRNCECCLIF